jgi:hypothetical protein
MPLADGEGTWLDERARFTPLPLTAFVVEPMKNHVNLEGLLEQFYCGR